MQFDHISSHYEEAVDERLKLALGGEPSDYYLRLKARELLDLLGRAGLEPRRAAVLDVGCGTGRMLELLKPDVGSIAGVEPSEGMLQRARERLSGVPLERVSGESLPFPDASFDAAFASCVFHHAPRAAFGPLVREMARVLKPGGAAVVFEHNPLNPLTRWVVARCPVDVGVVLVRPAELRTACAGAGLEDIATRYIVFFPRPLAALRPLEPALHGVPLGGQYYVSARKPFGAPSSGPKPAASPTT